MTTPIVGTAFMTSHGKMCFISHRISSGGKSAQPGQPSFVRTIADKLEARQVTCWLDEKHNFDGEKINETTLQGVADCSSFLAILSDGFFESKFCKAELDQAELLGKDIIFVSTIPLNELKTPKKYAQDHIRFLDGTPAQEDVLDWIAAKVKVYHDYRLQRKSINAGVPPRPNPPRRWALAMAIGCALLLVAGLLFYWQRTGLPKGPGVIDKPGEIRQPSVAILFPSNNGEAPFQSGGTQGGTVEIKGTSSGIGSHELIWLATVVNHLRYLQYGRDGAFHPGQDGGWSGKVEVGSSFSPPKPGDGEQVQAFVIGEAEYAKLREAQESGAPATLPEAMKPWAEVRFTLK